MGRKAPPWYCFSTSSTSSSIVNDEIEQSNVHCKRTHDNCHKLSRLKCQWTRCLDVDVPGAAASQPACQPPLLNKTCFLPLYNWQSQHLLWRWQIRCWHEIDPINAEANIEQYRAVFTNCVGGFQMWDLKSACQNFFFLPSDLVEADCSIFTRVFPVSLKVSKRMQ